MSFIFSLPQSVAAKVGRLCIDCDWGIGGGWYPLGGGGEVGDGTFEPRVITQSPIGVIRATTKPVDTSESQSAGQCRDLTTGQVFAFNCFAAPCNCPPNSVPAGSTATAVSTKTDTPIIDSLSAPSKVSVSKWIDIVKANPLPTAIVAGVILWAVTKK